MTPFYVRGAGFRPLTMSDAIRLSWADPTIRAKRSAAIRAAKDDPLHRALMRRVHENKPRDKNGRWV